MTRLTEEEKVAQRISDLVADLRLDIDRVGIALSELSSWEIVKRVLTMAETAMNEKDRVRRIYYSNETTTTKENKALILRDLWLNYKNDEEFEEFCQYNHVGLPLAVAFAEGIVESNAKIDNYIEEVFELLLSQLDIDDEGFNDLEEMFTLSDTTLH